MVVCGIIHRASEVFSLCDQPQLRSETPPPTRPGGETTPTGVRSRTPSKNDSSREPTGSHTMDPPSHHSAHKVGHTGHTVGDELGHTSSGHNPMHRDGAHSHHGGATPACTAALRPIPTHVLQSLCLLEAITAPPPPHLRAAGSHSSRQHKAAAKAAAAAGTASQEAVRADEQKCDQKAQADTAATVPQPAATSSEAHATDPSGPAAAAPSNKPAGGPPAKPPAAVAAGASAAQLASATAASISLAFQVRSVHTVHTCTCLSVCACDCDV